MEADACEQAADYARIARAIEFLAGHAGEQPPLEAVARHVGLSPFHLQRLFQRWAGVSPKKFLQAITLAHARRLLSDSATVLDAAHAVGLSGPSRLHDLFVAHEAMTPGAFRAGGAGLVLRFGFHDSPFGPALAAATDDGLAGLSFADDTPSGRARALEEMRERWPRATFVEGPDATRAIVAGIFERGRDRAPIRLTLRGTPFQLKVWEALLRIPPGHAVTYRDVARSLGDERAARAVGAAVGANPIAYVIPCHRVLRASGAIGGYRWGLVRKRAMLGFEARKG